jgi:hypothetical protein
MRRRTKLKTQNSKLQNNCLSPAMCLHPHWISYFAFRISPLSLLSPNHSPFTIMSSQHSIWISRTLSSHRLDRPRKGIAGSTWTVNLVMLHYSIARLSQHHRSSNGSVLPFFPLIPSYPSHPPIPFIPFIPFIPYLYLSLH